MTIRTPTITTTTTTLFVPWNKLSHRYHSNHHCKCHYLVRCPLERHHCRLEHRTYWRGSEQPCCTFSFLAKFACSYTSRPTYKPVGPPHIWEWWKHRNWRIFAVFCCGTSPNVLFLHPSSGTWVPQREPNEMNKHLASKRKRERR